jgi:FkbM family methyltransferase
MLITYEEIMNILNKNNICVRGEGGFHIGAHDCEEIPFYNRMGIQPVVWIDAIPAKVQESKRRGIPNVYHAVVTDKDDADVTFHVSNNGQSSSVLEFGTHAVEHPHVHYINTIQQKTITIDTFFSRNNIDSSKYTFWNFDIQGAELMALRGATKTLQYVKALYLEVNEKELYKNCGLIQDIDAFLATYHFKRVLTHMTPHGWGDALYIKDTL